MSDKEATARIKINKLLEEAGWRFFPDGTKPANIQLEPSVVIQSAMLDAFGMDFEKANPEFSTSDFRAVPEKYRSLVPEYIKDYVSLNQFAA